MPFQTACAVLGMHTLAYFEAVVGGNIRDEYLSDSVGAAWLLVRESYWRLIQRWFNGLLPEKIPKILIKDPKVTCAKLLGGLFLLSDMGRGDTTFFSRDLSPRQSFVACSKISKGVCADKCLDF